MLLIIDNYDSFVHNLARYCHLAEFKTQTIVRNDEITVDEISTLNPKAIVLSPGPKTPQDAGICINLIKKFGAHIPILGVCLGHQAIGKAYNYKIITATQPLHGQSAKITHDQTGIFEETPNPLDVGRYHSLVINPDQKGDLITTAKSDIGEIMAVQHKTHPVYGVQFHPESILTAHGLAILKNFKNIADTWNNRA